jgi:hypothetical protein
VIKSNPLFCTYKPLFWLVSAVFLALALPIKAAIIGQMPSFSEVLYITGEPCTSESGKVEPNWYFSYSVNAMGTVTRSCYVRYNDQIWIKGPYGSESTFPMSYFTKPADAGKADASPEVKQ